MYFTDRRDAGRRLAERLGYLADQDVVVLGLPRGGVPVAAEVAEALRAPLDVVLIRKLGVPFQPELGMGAIGEGGVRVINEEVVRMAQITDGELDEVRERETQELERRSQVYRRGRQRVPVTGRTVLVVDDGLATGSTARAACLVVRAAGAARVVLAVPVAPEGWTSRLADVADELVCLDASPDFFGVGQFYGDFAQTGDEEVVECLDEAARRSYGDSPSSSRAHPDPAPRGPGIDPEVVVHAGPVRLGGRLSVPEGAIGVVLFAHGSGSSRHSPRNLFVAEALNQAGLATLLFDLLTDREELDRANVFDTALLAGRLAAATSWLLEQDWVRDLPVGYFGASTGAAAALLAAAEPASPVAAIVSRGGRSDLADPRLPEVTAPTLLIVGGADPLVLELNRRSQALLGGPSRLAVVPGATHLFEEPGSLETVAALATEWFTEHLAVTS